MCVAIAYTLEDTRCASAKYTVYRISLHHRYFVTRIGWNNVVADFPTLQEALAFAEVAEALDLRWSRDHDAKN